MDTHTAVLIHFAYCSAGDSFALRAHHRPGWRVGAGLFVWRFGPSAVWWLVWVPLGLFVPVGWLFCAGLARGSVCAPSPVGSGFLVHSGAGVLATCIYASLGRFTITPRRGISGSAPYQCFHNLYTLDSNHAGCHILLSGCCFFIKSVQLMFGPETCRVIMRNHTICGTIDVYCFL